MTTADALVSTILSYGEYGHSEAVKREAFRQLVKLVGWDDAMELINIRRMWG